MRLIDADALMDALGIAVECKDCSRNGTFGCKEDSAFVYACESITDAPTIDAVEVVRCKDCKHRRNSKQGWYCGYEYDRSDPYEMTRRAYDENYYCADAERKEEDE